MTEHSDAEALATPDLVRAELADWVGEHWDPDLSLRDWRELLLEAGWAVPSWPLRWHGRGLPGWADELVAGELIRLGFLAQRTGTLADFEHTDAGLNQEETQAALTAGEI